MVRKLGRVYCAISFSDVVLWTELITKRGFWGKITCRTILNWVLSLNLRTTTRILMLWITNTRSIVLQSRCPQHYVIRTLWQRESKTVFESKIAQFSSVIKSPIFLQTRFKLWNSVFKILNFQNIEKLISLHMHFNGKGVIELVRFSLLRPLTVMWDVTIV